MTDTRTSTELVGQAIRQLRKRHNLTLQELAARLGTDAGNLSRIERGQQNYTPQLLDAVSEVFGVGVDTLFVEQERAEYQVDPHMRRVPVVGTAQLGDDGYYTELEYPVGHGDGYILYPTTNPNTYALRVKGDSMRPRIKPGEFVMVEPNSPVSPGDEVVVIVRDGRKMIKTLISQRGGQVELFSVNEEHKPITLDAGEIEAMHLVGGIIKPHRYYRDN